MSFKEWFDSLYPGQQMRVFEAVVGILGGIGTAFFIAAILPNDVLPIEPIIWIPCGAIGVLLAIKNLGRWL